MPIHTSKDGPRTFRYFTGENVGFLNNGAIVRLILHEKGDMRRTWAVHTRNGWETFLDSKEAGKVQLLDLLFERGDLVEFTTEKQALEEKHPGLEIPTFPT